jgi:hypothetical protein
MTSSLLLDLWRHGRCVVEGVCDIGFLEPPTRPQQLREKLFFPSCCHVLKLRERFSYPRLFQHVKPGSITSNQRQKDIPWNGSTKKRKFSFRQHARSRQQSSGIVRGWFLGMWWQEVRQSILMLTSVCWKKSWERFWLFHPHKNPAEILLQHDSARPHTS